MLADTFTQIFRDEHRSVRDTLLDLIRAFQDCDRARIHSLLGRVAALTGPHFRYEEEALYPGLVEIFGEEYIEKLLGDHDKAIGRAKILINLAGKDQLTDEDVAKATRIIRSILPHVSDCDGLSIMVALLPASKVQSVLEARDRSLAAGLDLVQWATHVRSRRPAAPDSL